MDTLPLVTWWGFYPPLNKGGRDVSLAMSRGQLGPDKDDHWVFRMGESQDSDSVSWLLLHPGHRQQSDPHCMERRKMVVGFNFISPCALNLPNAAD